MGKLILKTSFILLMTIMSLGGFAQTYNHTEQNAVIKGSTFKYRMEYKTGNTVVWTVSNGEVATKLADIDDSAKKYTVAEITWDAPGDYVVTVTESSNPGACPTETIFRVKVIDTPTGTITISTAFNKFCASNISIADKFKGSFTVTGGTAPYTCTITIKDKDGVTFTKNMTSNATGIFDIKGWEINDIVHFNVAQGDGTYVPNLIISNLKDKYTAPIALNVGDEIIPVTIYQNPVPSTIEHN